MSTPVSRRVRITREWSRSAGMRPGRPRTALAFALAQAPRRDASRIRLRAARGRGGSGARAGASEVCGFRPCLKRREDRGAVGRRGVCDAARELPFHVKPVSEAHDGVVALGRCTLRGQTRWRTGYSRFAGSRNRRVSPRRPGITRLRARRPRGPGSASDSPKPESKLSDQRRSPRPDPTSEQRWFGSGRGWASVPTLVMASSSDAAPARLRSWTAHGHTAHSTRRRRTSGGTIHSSTQRECRSRVAGRPARPATAQP